MKDITNAPLLARTREGFPSLNPAWRLIRLGLITQHLEDVCRRGPGLKTLDDVVEFRVREAILRLINDKVHSRGLVLVNRGQGISSDHSLVDADHTPCP